MATYAIGDSHGRSDLLSELLGEIDPSPADHVVFLGDYIDRGADSRGVIEQLVGLIFGIDCVASGQLLAIRFPDLKHWVVGNAA